MLICLHSFKKVNYIIILKIRAFKYCLEGKEAQFEKSQRYGGLS